MQILCELYISCRKLPLPATLAYIFAMKKFDQHPLPRGKLLTFRTKIGNSVAYCEVVPYILKWPYGVIFRLSSLASFPNVTMYLACVRC